MGLLETHKLDNAFVERCRRYTLLQILKKDNLLPMPYHSSQLCSGPCVKMSTRDFFVKQISDGDKDAECRPAYARLNNLAPGTKLRFECGQMWCDRVLVNVERFATFIDALQRAGVERCLPGYKGGAKDAAEYYYRLHTDYKFLEGKYGVVVLYLADPKEFADHETVVKCDNTCTSRITKPTNRKKPPITIESPTNTKKSSPIVSKTPPITKSSPIIKESPASTKKSPIIAKSSPIVTKTSTSRFTKPANRKKPPITKESPTSTKKSSPIVSKTPPITKSSPIIKESPTSTKKSPITNTNTTTTTTNTNTSINDNTNTKANTDSNTNVNGDTNTNTNEFEDLGWDDECVKQLILGEKKAIAHFKKNNINANTNINASTNTTNNTNTNVNTNAKANNDSNTSSNTNANSNINADTNTNANEFEDLGWDDECVKQLILGEKKAIALFKKNNVNTNANVNTDTNTNARTNTNNTSSITNANTNANANANADTNTNSNEFDDECVKQSIWWEKKTITLLKKNNINANTNANTSSNTNARTNNTNNTSSNTNAKANAGSNTNANANVNADTNTNTNEFEDLSWDDECVKQLILGEKKAIALFKKNNTNANTNTNARTNTNTSSNTNANTNAKANTDSNTNANASTNANTNAGTNTNDFADLDWNDECVNPPSVTKNLTRPSTNVLTVRAAITPPHTPHTHAGGRTHV
jgi:ASC-1-like (ASCH) protein